MKPGVLQKFCPFLSRCLRTNLTQFYLSIKTLIFLSLLTFASGQTTPLRQFPPLFNAAKDKPISTSPTDSTCGIPSRNAYCRSYTLPPSNNASCLQSLCVQDCPGRFLPANPVDLLNNSLSPGIGSCVDTDTVNRRPNSSEGSFAWIISQTGDSCYLFPVSNPDVGVNGAFTLTVWIWMENTIEGPLVQKVRADTGAVIFEVWVGPQGVRFQYLGSPLGTLTLDEPIPRLEWTFLAIQVYDKEVSFFLNGLGPAHSAARTFPLISRVQDVVGRFKIGKLADGSGQFLGRLQNFHFYSTTLSNREIGEVYSGTIPPVRIQSFCRCPAAYPRVKPQQTHYCIPNGVPDNAGSEVLRINNNSHPLEYVNDGDINSIWISKFFSKVNITVDLGDEFQVFYVVIQFYSPQPRGVVIERQRAGSDTWEVWQLYADNCTSYFGLPNNGPLPEATSVNCIQFGWGGGDIPYSRGNITFNILAPEPVPRPGHNDFYNTPELYQFVRAKRLRLHFRDHYYLGPDSPIRHQYYGIYDYTVSARCDCYGHAETCDTTVLPYTCNCSEESHTVGNQCSMCAPLYNNKAFQRGDQNSPFNCQLCQCYNHADSCVYNASVDPFPDDHDRGGGGVCVDCGHNTTGVNCESCLPLFYRADGVSMFAPDVCSECQCYVAGVVNGNMDCNKVGGQCECKVLVEGRQCDRCKPGYYDLQADNPAGCLPCQCDSLGTEGGETSCDPQTGQCNCKKNVRGDRCDQCEFGFFLLSADNDDGCSACDCDPLGSTTMFCDPDSGACTCKSSVIGEKCDECRDGFFNFTAGCVACGCTDAGSEPGTVCNKTTGQCVCKANTEGQNCDVCIDGAFSFGSSAELGCEPCICDPDGVLNGMALCDKTTGACVCKERVMGRRCNLCIGNTWGLNKTNDMGCDLCNCDPSGTMFGDTQNASDLACDQNTGQCTCLPNRLEQRCDNCQPGFYVDPDPGGGCRPCDCHPKGSLPGTNCDSRTGQCECQGGVFGVGGRTCSECLPDFYSFTSFYGACLPCDCILPGSLNNSCNSISGQCFCKEFVQGRTCAECQQGSSTLDPDNPFGCSKVPSQQPQPTHDPGTTWIHLYWDPPDYPNGVIQVYRIIRNNSIVANLTSTALDYRDEGLIPYTDYSYSVEAVNSFGSVRSTSVIYRTLAGVPSNDSILTVSEILSHSAMFDWTPPSIMNGPLDKYMLVSRTPSRPFSDLVHWEGNELGTVLDNLIPFTKYNFTLRTCTSGGCASNAVVMVTTLSSVPVGQASPNIIPRSGTELFITWDHPAQANGIIIFYELWMQGVPGPDGTRTPPLQRIFTSGGQYNPRPVTGTENNALPPPVTNFTVKGLEPFTVYEFQVLAQNDAGKASSPWTLGRTWEEAPIYTPPPTIVGVSSTELQVSWQTPTDTEARGVVVLYRVFVYRRTDSPTDPFAPPYVWKEVSRVAGNVTQQTVGGFTPYSEHEFKIEACNSIACVNSTTSRGRTLLAAPDQVLKPYVDGFNSSVMSIQWDPPVFQNGPSPEYKVEKTSIALSSPPQVVRGTRFPGGGYYKFKPDLFPQNVGFTGIRFKFRMKNANGLVFFTATPSQDEFFAVQFERGRPRLVFDTQGCQQVGKVTTTNDEGLGYSDSNWHSFVARRSGIIGRVIVDDVWKGQNLLRDKQCQNTSVIGQTTGVYVGGLPPDYKLARSGIEDGGFQGCLKDIEILQQEHPEEVWQKLNWEEAVANDLAFLNWEGCPLNLDSGAHFMGKGYARFMQRMFLEVQGDNFIITLRFRTAMHTGLLLFTHGGTGIYVYAGLIQGVLRFQFSDGQQTTVALFDSEDINFCDGEWRTVYLTKAGQQANLTLQDGPSVIRGSADILMPVPSVSLISLGGIKPRSSEEEFIQANNINLPFEAFGGCISQFEVNHFSYNFLKDHLDLMNLNMDGCPPFRLPPAPCEEKLVTTLYEGFDNVTYDYGLQPYTDYIYRVTAINAAGSSSGPWGYGRTREGAPVGVTPPDRMRTLSGFTIEAFWNKPTSTSGLLTKYVLTAYNEDDPQAEPISMEFTDAETRGANMTGLVPYTNYLMKMTACTSGGCTESTEGSRIRTDQEAPEKVNPPTADPGPTYLHVKWGLPELPNGQITGYFLYWENSVVYAGSMQEFNVTGLRVFFWYSLYIKACSVAGCTESPRVVIQTAQLPPSSVSRPQLQALGTSRVDVQWSEPEQLNGELERYILYLTEEESSLGSVVYNNSDSFLSYTIQNLTAGTEYFIRLSACTGGGCRRSEPSNVTTEESAPEDVPIPVVTSPSPSELVVIWGEPGKPNGEVVRYNLYQNGISVTDSLQREFRVGSLQPYSLHIFRVAACTNQGCGFSDEVEARTQESPPAGIVVLDISVVDPRTVIANWSAPASANGKIFYDVYFEGIFYMDPDQWNYTLVRERRSLYRDTTVYDLVSISGLVPMSSYSVQVNASNTRGFVLSSVRQINLPPGAPDGVKPPVLLSETSTTIKATWQPVGRVNADEEVAYTLQFREKKENAILQDVYGPTTMFSYIKRNLIPFSQYEFRLKAFTSRGFTYSEWVLQVTKQDHPVGLDPPLIGAVHARYISVSWSPPVSPNGIIQQYNIYQNRAIRLAVPGNQTTYQADSLTPFTNYTYSVEACNIAGCTRSEVSQNVRTLQAVPDMIAAPNLTALSPTIVQVSWSPPGNPNGILSQYHLDRRLNNTDSANLVVTLPAGAALAHIDESPTLSPFTAYQYRVRVVNSAGEGLGPWATIVTKPSRPAGVNPPSVQVLSSTSVNVTWQRPLQMNGVLEFYIIRLPEPRVEIRNVTQLSVIVSDLIPYTEYAVTLTACTSGGCTESSAVYVRTDPDIPDGQASPTPTAVSQSMISVLWQRPARPNGPEVNYELSRQKVKQPLDSGFIGPAEWQSIYTGSSFFYEDRGLPMFTTFRYRVTVFNNIGQKTSNASREVTTFGGFPRRAVNVTLTVVDHLSLLVEWSVPGPVDLQGDVDFFRVNVSSVQGTFSRTVLGGENSTLLRNLIPNTDYSVRVTVTIYGGASITSQTHTARTEDGAPSGLSAPTLTVISDQSLRVSWTEPERPNGEISSYVVYIDGRSIRTNQTTAGSIVVPGLQPYTVYRIWYEVCTEFNCTNSPVALGTTSEAVPQGVSAPTVRALSATEVEVTWMAPSEPNGITIRYEVWRHTLQKCSDIPVPSPDPEMTKCTYIQCSSLESLCGATCYSGVKECCDGVLYDILPGFACCGQKYLEQPSTDAVCCRDKFFSPITGYQCCGSRYVDVRPGEVCCPDNKEDRVSVGVGDQCCGSVPFSSTGAQMCCAEELHTRYGRMCCGGMVTTSSAVCCGNSSVGEVYLQQNLKTCCGSQYVDSETTLCCSSDTQHSKVHYYEDPVAKTTANEECCGLEKMSAGLSCCNFVGYNPISQVCADVSNSTSGCGMGRVCPFTQRSSAFCDVCDFDQSTSRCGSVRGYHVEMQTTTTPSETCSTALDKVYSGLNLTYIDPDLSPYSDYKFSMSVVNSAGTSASDYVAVTTLQAPPSEVRPPVPRVNPDTLYVIYLTWNPPGKPNGEITRYILTRDGVELYRGLDSSYTDDNAVLPYKTYTYTLSVCTLVGCTESNEVKVATAQAPPEDVIPPTLNVESSTTIRLTWEPPTTPNGVITMYRVIFPDLGRAYNHTPDSMEMIVTNMKPFTEYVAYLEVCSEAGCTRSENATAITDEAPPEGIKPPRVVIINSTTVQLYWREPSVLNGVLLGYKITRVGNTGVLVIYEGLDTTVADVELTPGGVYTYSVTAGTQGGETPSENIAVILPEMTPPTIPPPQRVVVLSAEEISVSWDPVLTDLGEIDQYKVLLNVGQETEVEESVGTQTSVIVSNLRPFTDYEVRIQACLKDVQNGCGTSDGVIVKTEEAPPLNQRPPELEAQAADTIHIAWQAPSSPNGEITLYRIYQRRSGDSNEILINQVPGNIFEFTHSGTDLLPYTLYEYRIKALNGEGETVSDWARVRTLEAPPEEFSAPFVSSAGPYGFFLQWTPPAKPNGVITRYRILYKAVSTDPTVQNPQKTLAIEPDVTSTSVSGLLPNTNYEMWLEAVNKAGRVTSSVVPVTTGEASPAGLGTFQVEKIFTGQAVILRWNLPLKPNGVVSNFRIYEVGSDVPIYQGLNREFEFRRLTPFTEYFVQLEACTLSGCTLGQIQSFTTAEISPSNQQPPTLGFANSTHVIIEWNSPSNPNGRITSYEILRRADTLTTIRKKRELSEPTVVYKTTETDKDQYSFTDIDVEPFTEYQYKIRANNSRGSVESPWQTVFTAQAAPEGVAAPSLTHTDDVNSLLVTWTPPDVPNGVIQSYQLQRNDSVPLSFPSNPTFQHIDSGLEAYTIYSYRVTVCSGGGCTTSDITSIRTKEAAPLQVLPPDLVHMGSTAIKATWQKPQITNGEVNRYELLMDGTSVYEGLAMEFVVGDLIPYHQYTFLLRACTTGGCSDSREVMGRPDDAKPVGMNMPILRVMSSSSIEVSWSSPTNPNGVITSYDVIRDGTLIFTDSLETSGVLRTLYTDYSLDAGEEYTYSVVARNRKGSVESPPSKAKTYSSSPSGLNPPSLLPMSPSSIQVTWEPPVRPNGDIIKYQLYTGNDKVYEGGPDQLSYIVPGLDFYTEYTIRVEACTERGCELSEGVTERTLEALPEGQAAPTLLALANEQRAHSGVLVTWKAPEKPNGVIVRFELLRRHVVLEDTGSVYGDAVSVFNGSALSLTDSDPLIKAFSTYQYMVTAFNSVGGVSSIWGQVVTKEAPPTSVAPPTIERVTSTTMTVIITPPLKPNGIIREYNVLVNNTVASSGVILNQTAGLTRPLLPFMTYLVQVRACTGGGCTDSSGVKVITGTAKPMGLAPVEVSSKTGTTVTLEWKKPSQPNGHIQRYLLYHRKGCPPTDQPFQQTCVPGDVFEVYSGLNMFATAEELLPYTHYQFQIQAENEAGVADFPQWVSSITDPELPEYVAFPRLTTNLTKALIDWTGSFQLNSRLREYILMADGKVVFRGVTTRDGVERETKDQVIRFVVQAVTETGQAESPTVIFDPSAIDNVGITEPPPEELNETATPFYSEIWFIIIMICIALFILFLIIFLCMRSFGARKAYVRERAPLHGRYAKPPRTRPYYIDVNSGSVVESDFMVRRESRAENMATYHGPDMGVINPAFLNPAPTRYTFDKISRSSKTEDDDDDENDVYWEKNFDSGWYDEDAESLSGPAYSYTREQTVFTDTHL